MLQFSAKRINTRLVLRPEDFARSFGAVEDAVEVRGNDGSVVRQFTVNHAALSPRNSGVGYEDIQSTAQIVDGLLQNFANVVEVGSVDLIRLA